VARVRHVVAGKVEAQVRSQTQEPLVRIVHSCDIHYAEEVPNGHGGTTLEMTTKTLSAEAIVPASKAIELAKDLAEQIYDESNNPCHSYDCQNAKCKGWIATLNELREEYKHLQDREPDYEVDLMSDDWYNSLVNWALDYTKEHELLDDFAKIASYALAEVTDEIIEELLEAGYSPEGIFNAFSKYLDENEVLYQMCHLKDDYPEVAEFLKEMNFNCDEE